METKGWRRLLAFEVGILEVPARGTVTQSSASDLQETSRRLPRQMVGPGGDPLLTEDGLHRRAGATRAERGGTTAAAIPAKLEDGNISAAAGILCSDEFRRPQTQSNRLHLADTGFQMRLRIRHTTCRTAPGPETTGVEFRKNLRRRAFSKAIFVFLLFCSHSNFDPAADTLGDSPGTVEADVGLIKGECLSLSLAMNHEKCELITVDYAFDDQIPLHQIARVETSADTFLLYFPPSTTERPTSSTSPDRTRS